MVIEIPNAGRTIQLRIDLVLSAMQRGLPLLMVSGTGASVFCGTATNFATWSSGVLMLLSSWCFVSLSMSECVCITVGTMET